MGVHLLVNLLAVLGRVALRVGCFELWLSLTQRSAAIRLAHLLLSVPWLSNAVVGPTFDKLVMVVKQETLNSNASPFPNSTSYEI